MLKGPFLRSVTRSDLRFPLATGSPVGTSPFCFSWPLCLSSGYFVSFWRMFPGSHPCFSIQGYFSSFVFLPGFVPLSLSIGGFRYLRLFCVFPLLFVLPYWIICCFYLSCPLPFFSVPPLGSLQFPSLLWGSSLPGLSPSPWVSLCMVPSSFILLVLVPAFPLCSCFSSHLCVLTVFLVSALGLSLAS